MKRKKRYKHANIGKKKYYFYSIRWLDITGDAGHATPEEFDKFGCAVMVHKLMCIRKIVSSYGRLLLMMKRKKCLVIGMYFLKVVL